MVRCNIKILILLLVFSASFKPLFGGDDPSHQIWLDYNPSWWASGKLVIYGDLGARTIFPNDWNRLLVRGGLNYKPFASSNRKAILKELQLHAGVGDFYTFTTSGENLNEFRLFQGIRVFWPKIAQIRFSHYIRSEQRWERLVINNISEFSARLRYLLTADFGFRSAKLRFLSFPCSVEFFASYGSGIYFNDAMRVTPAVSFEISDNIHVELNLSYHYYRSTDVDGFQHDNLVYRLRFFHMF